MGLRIRGKKFIILMWLICNCVDGKEKEYFNKGHQIPLESA